MHPPLRDRRFWLVQGLAVLISLLHLGDDLDVRSPMSDFPHFAAVSLFLLPVVYAALNFGLAGSCATALWAVVLSLPDLMLIDAPRDRLEDIIQLTILLAVAIFVGERVERERLARTDLETAQANLRAYASKILTAQEEEQRRIGQELHDEPLQELIVLARRLEAISAAAMAPDDEQRSLVEAHDLAIRIAENLRNTSQGLRPPGLDELGLPAALRRLVRQMQERTRVRVNFAVTEGRRRAAPVELGIFRIAQEALHNVERHAAATNVAMSLSMDGPVMVLEVRDDGVGFQTDRRQQGTLGLLGMRERAQLMGGHLMVRSQPGAGTLIRLEVSDAPSAQELAPV